MFRLVVLSLALVPCLGFHPGSVRSFARPQWSSLAPRTTTRDFLLAHDGAANDHSPSSVAAIPVALQGVPSSMARALSVRGGGLLKGLDPLLTADLLHVLRAAGHGDLIAVVDVNFPAASTATHTTTGKHIMLAGADAPATLGAIGSVLPLDLFVDNPVGYMVPSPGNERPPAADEVHAAGVAALAKHCGGATPGVEEIERFEFYERAKKAFAVVQTGAERRPYGCFLVQKGVVGPDGNDLIP